MGHCINLGIPSSLQLGDVLSVSVDTTGLRGSEVFALDNGLALTPPMGWMTWQRYRCETDCSGPGAKRCINEDLIKEMADQMAEAWGRVLCGVLFNIYFNLSIHFDRQLVHVCIIYYVFLFGGFIQLLPKTDGKE